MTHVAWRQSGLPPTHVIGAGCNLDSERLSHILNVNLNTRKPAWVLGELSDSKCNLQEMPQHLSITATEHALMFDGVLPPTVAVMSNIGLNSSSTPEISAGSTSTKPLLDRCAGFCSQQEAVGGFCSDPLSDCVQSF